MRPIFFNNILIKMFRNIFKENFTIYIKIVNIKRINKASSF